MVFLYPAFLLGLLSLAIPIIIHLVELRRPKRLIFTNVGFLREVKQITASSRRLKRLLILLARLLLLTALVLAFAQPFLPARNAAATVADDVRVYLDNSLSMQNTSRTAAVALFDEAKSQVRQLAGVFGTATRFRLLDNSFEGGLNGTAVQPLLDRVAGLTLTARRNPLDAVVSRLTAGDETSRPGTKIFLYSDFQRNTFNPRTVQAAVGGAEVYLMPLEAQSTQNVFVDTVLLTDEFVRAAESNRLLVRIANNGKERAAGISVKVYVDQQQVSAYSLDLEPGEKKATEIDFRVSGDGVKRGRVEINDQPVTFDNTYYFTLRVAPPIRVFGIGPGQETTAQKAFAAEPAFQYTAADERSLNYRTAAESDLILLQDLPSISAGLTDNVRKFVRAGGSLLVMPSDKADHASYEALFTGLGLSGVRWLPASGTPTPQPLQAPDARDPFFHGVFTSPDAAMTMPKAAPVLTWARSSRDMLRLRSGAPFLSAFQVGKGTVYLLAAPLAREYSDFAANALFVPTLYRLAQQSYRAPQQLAYGLERQSIAIPVANADGRKEVFKLVRDDSTTFIPEQQVRDGRLIFGAPAEMTQAGFYTLRKPGEVPTVLAFNYDKRESDLAQYSATELKQVFSANKRIHVYEPGAGLAAVEQFREENFGQPLWKYCIGAALLFLLIEVLLVRFL